MCVCVYFAYALICIMLAYTLLYIMKNYTYMHKPNSTLIFHLNTTTKHSNITPDGELHSKCSGTRCNFALTSSGIAAQSSRTGD